MYSALYKCHEDDTQLPSSGRVVWGWRVGSTVKNPCRSLRSLPDDPALIPRELVRLITCSSSPDASDALF